MTRKIALIGWWSQSRYGEMTKWREAKKDGFESQKDMFTWFDKRYYLSEPKEFWVYRWKYSL